MTWRRFLLHVLQGSPREVQDKFKNKVLERIREKQQVQGARDTVKLSALNSLSSFSDTSLARDGGGYNWLEALSLLLRTNGDDEDAPVDGEHIELMERGGRKRQQNRHLAPRLHWWTMSHRH